MATKQAVKLEQIRVLLDNKKADHVYQSDMASRDPECAVEGCQWSWSDHPCSNLLKFMKKVRGILEA